MRIYTENQEERIVLAKVKSLRKSKLPQDKREADDLLKWLRTAPSEDPLVVVGRGKKLAALNEQVKVCRLRTIYYGGRLDENCLSGFADLFQGEAGKHLAELFFMNPVPCTDLSPSMTAFLRGLTALKSLRKAHFAYILFSDALLAALFLTRVKILEFGSPKRCIKLQRSEYDRLCQFLGCHSHFKRLSLHVFCEDDPELSEAFLAMNRNETLILEVFLLT
jgi:hypothetical protein